MIMEEDCGLVILGYDEECRGMGIEKHVGKIIDE